MNIKLIGSSNFAIFQQYLKKLVPQLLRPSTSCKRVIYVDVISEEPMIPDDHDDVDMHHFDPKADWAQENHR